MLLFDDFVSTENISCSTLEVPSSWGARLLVRGGKDHPWEALLLAGIVLEPEVLERQEKNEVRVLLLSLTKQTRTTSKAQG